MSNELQDNLIEEEQPVVLQEPPRKVYNFLHQYDIFAKPITLSFNGKPQFATVPGALCSFFVLLFFLGFTII